MTRPFLVALSNFCMEVGISDEVNDDVRATAKTLETITDRMIYDLDKVEEDKQVELF